MEPSSTATILVVDDHPANRELARATLEDEGYRVVLATNGLEGVDAFEREKPDCVLLDVRMPGLDGFGACERIRTLPDGADTPILFFTAFRDLETFDHAQRVGGDDFLTKPVNPGELLLRVQAALKLRRMSAERSDLVGMLRRQRDALMRAALHTERLTAFLVHDLKNPVGGMQMGAEMILGDAGASPRTHQTARLIRDSAERMNRMILDLLDINRSDAGELVVTRAPIDLAPLLDQVAEAHRVRAQAQAVTLEVTADAPTVHADLPLLRRVLENLVENAIRHAPRQSTVRLVATAVAEAVEFRVADEGTGVPTELRERIFDRWVQADGHGVGRAGRGLGLAFCKLVVDAHEGAIRVEDGLPGAVFCVKLPHGR